MSPSSYTLLYEVLSYRDSWPNTKALQAIQGTISHKTGSFCLSIIIISEEQQTAF